MNKRFLCELCTLIMGQSPDSKSYNKENDGIPFYQGNADFGADYPTPSVWCSDPKKIAIKDDILISVRAPIGDINIATEDCCIGRGLAAIRLKDNNLIEMKYLYNFLGSIVPKLQDQGTGSTFKAINKGSLEKICIPCPSLEEQKRISSTITKIRTAIIRKKDQLIALDNLVKSRFIEMFGDPITNSKNLPELTLPELGEFGRGVSKHRPRNAPELLGGKYPLIQTGEVANAELYINGYTNTYSELGYKQSKMWKAGTLCITIAANIAKTGILSFDACFPDSIVGFHANEKTNNIFIHFWFTFFQEILEAQAPASAQKNINLRILSELKVIVPPIELQNEFADFVKLTDKSKFIVQKQIEDLQELLDSKMDEYFG